LTVKHIFITSWFQTSPTAQNVLKKTQFHDWLNKEIELFGPLHSQKNVSEIEKNTEILS
jgi:hypothetical protein